MSIDELHITISRELAIDLNRKALISVIYVYTTVSYPLKPKPATKNSEYSEMRL